MTLKCCSVFLLIFIVNCISKIILTLAVKVTIYMTLFCCFSLSEGVVGTELDAHALMSRKSRTQVFSGRKSAPTEGGECS